VSDRLLVGTRKGLFVLEREGGGWAVAARQFLGVEVSMVLQAPRTGTLHAAVKHGHFGTKLHRSTDGGRTFVEAVVPQYPPKPEGLEDVDPFRKQPVPWNLQVLWSLEPGTAAQPGRLWAGTIPGGLFKSDDDGATWTLVRSLWDHEGRKRWGGGGYDFAGIHSIAVHPEDGRKLSVGVSVGGIWRTEDDGETWSCEYTGMRAEFMPPELAHDPIAQDPHRVVRCPTAPDVLWCQHHNGLFRSTDGGATWTELQGGLPSTFGFAMAVHPTEPDTAWVVPATKDELRLPKDGRVVVGRTRDGGETFELLTKGLPQEDAYDLVYRHALDVDGTGRGLALGSTTGALWYSDDQGDSFTCVNAHLPPIYCVRFG
jgi:hypothetical protein